MEPVEPPHPIDGLIKILESMKQRKDAVVHSQLPLTVSKYDDELYIEIEDGKTRLMTIIVNVAEVHLDRAPFRNSWDDV